MSDRRTAWPALEYDQLAPMVRYLNRLVQVGAKYSLDEPFEAGWGNAVLDVTPRGLRTPVFRQDDVTFAVHHRLLDGDVVIEADRGTRTLPLSRGSVADFYTGFCAAAAELGIRRPPSSLICEIPDAPPTFSDDHTEYDWDPAVARRIWTALDRTDNALHAWQAPFLGHRPRVGVMFGEFDLSATRWRATPTTPPPDRPPFQQNAQLHEYVSVGFSFGSPHAPIPGMYAYIWPQPENLAGRRWGVDAAEWNPGAGLVRLPWEALRDTENPRRAIVDFGDAVYQAAVETAGWPADLVTLRVDGWYMSTTPPEVVEQRMHGRAGPASIGHRRGEAGPDTMTSSRDHARSP